MLIRKGNCRAQSILEFAAVIAIVVAALMAMRIYAKRAYVGKLREGADRMGDQFSPQGHIYSWTTKSNSSSHDEVFDTGASNTTNIVQNSSREGNESYNGHDGETFWPNPN